MHCSLNVFVCFFVLAAFAAETVNPNSSLCTGRITWFRCIAWCAGRRHSYVRNGVAACSLTMHLLYRETLIYHLWNSIFFWWYFLHFVLKNELLTSLFLPNLLLSFLRATVWCALPTTLGKTANANTSESFSSLRWRTHWTYSAKHISTQGETCYPCQSGSNAADGDSVRCERRERGRRGEGGKILVWSKSIICAEEKSFWRCLRRMLPKRFFLSTLSSFSLPRDFRWRIQKALWCPIRQVCLCTK